MGEFAGDRDDDDDGLEQFNVEWYDQNNLQWRKKKKKQTIY